MLVDKGANLAFNDETILHVIMKRKFKDLNKKKKFMKELSNRWQLSLTKDKDNKLPVQYETDSDIRIFYLDIFKPKVKVVEKEHHPRSKDKDIGSPNSVMREKEQKKRQKEEEQKIVPEEEVVEEEENDEDTFASQLQKEEEKEKIVEVIEEEEDERKVEDDKEKHKKAPSKILTPNVILNAKKIVKPVLKIQPEKAVIPERSFIS